LNVRPQRSRKLQMVPTLALMPARSGKPLLHLYNHHVRGLFDQKPRERGETGEQDLFRSRLDQIIDLNRAPVKLVKRSTGSSWSNASERCIRRAWPSALADAADGGFSDAQARSRSFRRGLVRALDREPFSTSAARRSSSISSPSTARRGRAGANAWARNGLRLWCRKALWWRPGRTR
jgi:hypothetical protein